MSFQHRRFPWQAGLDPRTLGLDVSAIHISATDKTTWAHNGSLANSGLGRHRRWFTRRLSLVGRMRELEDPL